MLFRSAFEGKDPVEPDVMLKSKGALKVWDRVRAGLKLNNNGEAAYLQDGAMHRMMTSGGPVKTATLKNAVIQ